MKVLPKWIVACAAVAIAVSIASTLSTAHAEGGESTPTAKTGQQLYTSYCARCHGLAMVSNGSTFDLRSFPKDQRDRFERSVTQGLRAMPAWGSIFKPEDVQSLWLYVSSGSGS